MDICIGQALACEVFTEKAELYVMDLKSGGGWALIILAVTLAFCVGIRPFIQKKVPQQVTASELFPLGVDDDGESWYVVMQQEAKEWVGILTPILTVVGTLLGIFIGRKRENKRR